MPRGEKLALNIGAKFEESNYSIKQKPKKDSIIKSSGEIIESNKHQLVFQREKRRGKAVILVGEFCLSKDDLGNLSKKIKKKLGIGGTVSENWLEFQGEVQEKLKPILEQEGFKLKRK